MPSPSARAIFTHTWPSASTYCPRPCALGSRRVEESSKACRARARARFLRTHGHLLPLTVSHTTLAICVTARARREPRGCQCFLGVKDLKEKNMFDLSAKFSIYCYYIPFPIIYSKSTFVIVNNLQKIIV